MVDNIRRILFNKEWLRVKHAEQRHLDAFFAREKNLDNEVNRRVASTLSKMDPFEPLMKEFNGIFSQENEHVEDSLDARGQLMLRTWGYQNADSIAFKYLTDWVMNTQANETLKKAPVTEARILYGRAQISCMLLFVKEVKRLSEAYKDMLGKKDDYDPSTPVDT